MKQNKKIKLYVKLAGLFFISLFFIVSAFFYNQKITVAATCSVLNVEPVCSANGGTFQNGSCICPGVKGSSCFQPGDQSTCGQGLTCGYDLLCTESGGGGSGATPPPSTNPPPTNGGGTGSCPEGLSKVNGVCLPDKTNFPTTGIAGSTSLIDLITKVIQLMLFFAGIIAVVFLVLGGYWYMASGGNEELAEKGKKTIVNFVLGLVVIIMAYAIVTILYNTLS